MFSWVDTQTFCVQQCTGSSKFVFIMVHGLNEGHIAPCTGSRTLQKLLRKLETNFIGIWIKIQLQEMNMKMMFAKCQPFFLCLNVRHAGIMMHKRIRKLGHDWFRLCLVACLMPSHYLKPCWITANASVTSHSRAPYGLFLGCSQAALNKNCTSTYGAHMRPVRRLTNFASPYGTRTGPARV